MRGQNQMWMYRVCREDGDDIGLMQVGVSRSWMSHDEGMCVCGKDHSVRVREWVERWGTRRAR
jgi:hypothetical protein